jgi:hypothetical protein
MLYNTVRDIIRALGPSGEESQLVRKKEERTGER